MVLVVNNLLADLLIYQTFFCQMLKKSQFTKLSPGHTFPLYGIMISEYLCELQYKLNLLCISHTHIYN